MVLEFRLFKGEYVRKIYYKLTFLLKQVALNILFGIWKEDLNILYTNQPIK